MTAIAFKSEKERERAKTIAIAIVGRAITLKRGPYRNIGKMNDWMATYLFCILVVAILFSPTVVN